MLEKVERRMETHVWKRLRTVRQRGLGRMLNMLKDVRNGAMGPEERGGVL